MIIIQKFLLYVCFVSCKLLIINSIILRKKIWINIKYQGVRMKKFLIIALVIAFTAMTASAQIPAKPITIYGSAGISLPSSPSEFSDSWKMGFHGMGGVGFNIAPKMQLIGKIEYHSFAFDWDKAGLSGSGLALQALMFGGDIKFSLAVPAAPTKPFLIGGIGMGKVSFSNISGVDETKVYFEFGGGVDFSSSMFISARYVSISSSGSSTGFIPFSIGFKF